MLSKTTSETTDCASAAETVEEVLRVLRVHGPISVDEVSERAFDTYQRQDAPATARRVRAILGRLRRDGLAVLVSLFWVQSRPALVGDRRGIH